MAKKETNKRKITKVIYFDEQSVTDYVQIVEGGTLTKTLELLDTTTAGSTVKAEAKASFGFGKIFRSLVGIGAELKGESELSGSFRDDEFAKSILQNTILTDFLEIVNDSEDIKIFEDRLIRAALESLSYVVMVSPYMTMFKDSSAFIKNMSKDFELNIDKIDSSLKFAKGYYELLGIDKNKNDPDIILRFNIDVFKNNYKITDLLKMDLVIYAIKVGVSSKRKLSAYEEFSLESNGLIDNPEYGQGKSSKDDELLVYDVLLAGVKG